MGKDDVGITNDIKTVYQFGRYELIGPVRLPLRLPDGKVNPDFSIWYFGFSGGRYEALILGEVSKSKAPLVRITSICIWAHLFDSQYCDCEWQLGEAKQRISDEGAGVIIFALDEHGKAVGIRNHNLVYAEGYRRGLECVIDAYTSLGFNVDYRTNYGDAADILKHFGVSRARLMSNNPERLNLLEEAGISVEHVPLEMPLTQWNEEELTTKKRRLGHLLRLSGE